MTTINHWGLWIDSDQPIAGVVSMHSVEWINEEIDAGVDLSYEEAIRYCIEEEIAAWQHKTGDYSATPDEELIEEWRYKFGDLYYDNGDSEYLIGAWAIGEDGKYSPDTTGEYAAIANCGSNVVQVVYSRYVTRCALCSPCYPGQGDLDTAGDFIAYDLPLSLYGEYRQNDNAQEEYSAGAAQEEEAH